jgi:hypothetical protein
MGRIRNWSLGLQGIGHAEIQDLHEIDIAAVTTQKIAIAKPALI